MARGFSARVLGSRFASLGVVVAIAACHGGISASPASEADGGGPMTRGVPLTGYASGSRLHARVLDGGGDTVRFEGFVDTKLGVRCDFAVATDGVARCLPATDDSIVDFADPMCTKPVIVASSGCSAPPYLRLNTGPAAFCTWEPRLEAGPQEVLAPDSPLGSIPPLYTGTTSSCTPETTTPPTGSTVYTTRMVAPSTFVSATEATDPRGARIGARVLLAQDGAAQVMGYYDEKVHAPCDVIQESIGWRSDLCIPTTMSWANDWADAACTQVAAHIGSQCPKPTIGVDASFPGNCDQPTIHAYSIGAPLATSYSGGNGNACSVNGPDSSENYFATGSPIDLATIPAVGILPMGASSLRPYFRASPDGVPILPAGLGVLPNSGGALFRDATHDTDCWATQLTDGSWRCLPGNSVHLEDLRYFADPACTQELVDAGDFSSACPPLTPAIAVRLSNTSCGSANAPVEAIYALGASMPAGAGYQQASAGAPCQPTMLPVGDTIYALGAQVDVTTFPALTERTE